MSNIYENNYISLIEKLNPNNILIIDTFGEILNIGSIKNQLKTSITINIVNNNPSFNLKKIEYEEKNIKLYESLSEINCLDNDVIIINANSEETIKEILNTIYTDDKNLPLVLINTETYIEETYIEDEVEEKNKKGNITSVKEIYSEHNELISNIKIITQKFIIESSKNLFYQEIYTSPFMILIYEKKLELFNKINSLELLNTEKEMYLNKLNKIYYEERIVKNQPRLLLKRNEILSKQTMELFEIIEVLEKQLKEENNGKLNKFGLSKINRIKSMLKNRL